MSKRIRFAIMLITICVVLCSCINNTETAPETSLTEVGELENLNILGTIVTEKNVYSTEDTKIKYTLYVTENYTNDTVYIDANPLRELHRLIDDKWYKVPFRTDENVVFIFFGGDCPLGDILNHEIDLNKYFDLPLPSGEYRILTSDNIVSNTFKIE